MRNKDDHALTYVLIGTNSVVLIATSILIKLLQITIGGIIEDFAALVKTETVTGSVSGVFGVVPFQRVAEVWTALL